MDAEAVRGLQYLYPYDGTIERQGKQTHSTLRHVDGLLVEVSDAFHNAFPCNGSWQGDWASFILSLEMDAINCLPQSVRDYCDQ